MLVIFRGLPGVGKTTLAREVARRCRGVYLRLDTIEAPLLDRVKNKDIGPLGYKVGYGVAEENLRIGHTVIADSVNPFPLTRQSWQDVARKADTPFLDIEVVCSDKKEHKRRVERRNADIPHFILPTWEQVYMRAYEPSPDHPFTVDTARLGVEEGVTAILNAIKEKITT